MHGSILSCREKVPVGAGILGRTLLSVEAHYLSTLWSRPAKESLTRVSENPTSCCHHHCCTVAQARQCGCCHCHYYSCCYWCTSSFGAAPCKNQYTWAYPRQVALLLPPSKLHNFGTSRRTCYLLVHLEHRDCKSTCGSIQIVHLWGMELSLLPLYTTWLIIRAGQNLVVNVCRVL